MVSVMVSTENGSAQ